MEPRRGPTLLVWVLVILAGGACLCIPITAAILFPVFSQAKASAQSTLALSQVKMMATSVAIYAADNNDRFPPGPVWHDVTAKADPSIRNLEFPNVPPGLHIIAFNQALGAKPTASVKSPATEVMLFEIPEQPNANAVGNPKSAMVPGRYNRKTLYAFVDGSAKAVRAP